MDNKFETVTKMHWMCTFSGTKNEIMIFKLTERVDIKLNLITGKTCVMKDNTCIAEDQFFLSEEISFNLVIEYLQMQYRDACKLV